MMNRINKIENKHGSIAGFKAMLLEPLLNHAQEEIYLELLQEVMENKSDYKSEDLNWFFAKGEEYGFLRRVEEPTLPDNSWKKWEEQ
jgi:hypothetical protein